MIIANVKRVKCIFANTKKIAHRRALICPVMVLVRIAGLLPFSPVNVAENAICIVGSMALSARQGVLFCPGKAFVRIATEALFMLVSVAKNAICIFGVMGLSARLTRQQDGWRRKKGK